MADGVYKNTGSSKNISIYDVANYFISLANSEKGNFITIMGLQKLCFFTHAWSLVWGHKPLFEEEFESGEYGPFSYALLEKYQDLRNGTITECDMGFNPNIFTNSQKDMMDAVWNAHGIHLVYNIDNMQKKNG